MQFVKSSCRPPGEAAEQGQDEGGGEPAQGVHYVAHVRVVAPFISREHARPPGFRAPGRRSLKRERRSGATGAGEARVVRFGQRAVDLQEYSRYVHAIMTGRGRVLRAAQLDIHAYPCIVVQCGVADPRDGARLWQASAAVVADEDHRGPLRPAVSYSQLYDEDCVEDSGGDGGGGVQVLGGGGCYAAQCRGRGEAAAGRGARPATHARLLPCMSLQAGQPCSFLETDGGTDGPGCCCLGCRCM